MSSTTSKRVKKTKTDTTTTIENLEQDNDEYLKKTYKKMNPIEHIIKRPDMYVGNTKPEPTQKWTFDEESLKIVKKNINISNAFISIVEEIIVNAYDNFNRVKQLTKETNNKTLKKVSYIKINVAKTDDEPLGIISVENDGEGIDIAIHPIEKIYIPTMIFSNLLSSGNYDDTQERLTGGRNGYGAKLTNVYSKMFKVETVDYKKKLKFTQIFHNNLSVADEPLIEKYTDKPFTRISFYPDYEKFEMDNGITDVEYNLIRKRAYDMVACSNGEIEAYFNDDKIEVENFEKYMNLYITVEPSNATNDEIENDIASSPPPQPETPKLIYEKINDRWYIGCCLSPFFTFEQVSFTNGICTKDGGTNVNYVLKQICDGLVDYIKKKNKITIRPNVIKENLMLFVNSIIVNPKFNNQTKDSLASKKAEFGSTCEISAKFISTLATETGIVERAIASAQFRDTQILAKTDGKKTSRKLNIPKLDDAAYAGTSKSSKCSLILTEGDSAKSMAVSGLNETDRLYYGIFPLRGKLINTRDKSQLDQAQNEEITNIKRILGLREGKNYENLSELRYGRLIIMTDQDVDGSHIKGLIINFLSKWESLLKSKGFITSLLTPIVKATKNKNNVISFYTLTEFENWRNSSQSRGWTIKYYKGLGTSTGKEAKEYFTNKRLVEYVWDDNAVENIDMAFRKNRADDRKEWLMKYDRNSIIEIDNENTEVSYSDFINKELIHYDQYNCERSIPNICDGFKPSLRKVIYSVFKRNLNSELKVAQLAGYVSEHSAYHHGENSLYNVIIGLAQNYVGSNNINLLEPRGQFGTRRCGGEDSASPRYIFTNVSPITHKLFDARDMNLFKYKDDDGYPIEPEYYVPILPVILINGVKGIATGWSTDVPQFNPIDVVNNIKRIMDGNEPEEMMPWFRGFRGTIEKIDKNKWLSRGSYTLIGTNKIIIRELPIGMWNSNFTPLLDRLMNGEAYKSVKDKKNEEKAKRGRENLKKVNEIEITTKRARPRKQKTEGELSMISIKNYIDKSTDTVINYEIIFDENVLSALLSEPTINGKDPIERLFKLTSNISATNMNMFDSDIKLNKYDTPIDVLKDFYNIRLKYYAMRRKYMMDKLEEDLKLVETKIKFIKDVINGTIVVNNQPKTHIIKQLIQAKYPVMVEKKLVENKHSSINNENENYDYLLKMPIYSLTKERIDKFEDEFDKLMKELDFIRGNGEVELWRIDIDNFVIEYKKHMKEYYEENSLNEKDFAQKTSSATGRKLYVRRKSPPKKT